jgi:hypothetical protein
VAFSNLASEVHTEPLLLYSTELGTVIGPNHTSSLPSGQVLFTPSQCKTWTALPEFPEAPTFTLRLSLAPQGPLQEYWLWVQGRLIRSSCFCVDPHYEACEPETTLHPPSPHPVCKGPTALFAKTREGKALAATRPQQL